MMKMMMGKSQRNTAYFWIAIIYGALAIYYLGMLSLGGSQAVWSADPVNIENLMKDGIESNRPQPIAVKQSIASSNAGIETNVPSPSAEKQNSSSVKDNSFVYPGDLYILLNGYMRGGTTFIGRVLTNQKRTFSVMEPLWKLTTFGYHTIDNQLCAEVTPTCRHLNATVMEKADIHDYVKGVNKSELPLSTAYRIIQSVNNCSLDSLDGMLDEEAFIGPEQIADSWKKYRYCRRGNSLEVCINNATIECKNSNIRVTKVIRLGLNATRRLLEQDENLKVVQLVRDPRGILHSRLIKAEWYPLRVMSGNFTTFIDSARALCERMISDHIEGRRLMKVFPNRVIFIRYDDFVSPFNQRAYKRLTTFLGLEERPFRQEVQDGFEFRSKMGKPVVEIVDKECSKVYEAYGYRNLSYSLLREGLVNTFIPYFTVY